MRIENVAQMRFKVRHLTNAELTGPQEADLIDKKDVVTWRSPLNDRADRSIGYVGLNDLDVSGIGEKKRHRRAVTGPDGRWRL